MYAAHGNLDMLKEMVEADINVLKYEDENGWQVSIDKDSNEKNVVRKRVPPLHLSIRENHSLTTKMMPTCRLFVDSD